MGRDRFDGWRKRGANLGQRRLADAIRRLIYQTDESLFDQLDFSKDAIFLQPSLFAFFTEPSRPVGLRQILYGSISPSERPVELPIMTDSSGCAHLGSFAHIETAFPSAVLRFGRRNDGSYYCHDGSAREPFRMRAPLIVPGTPIEVTTEVSPLYYRFFDQPDGPMTDARMAQAPRECVSSLLTALGLIRTHCPAVWAEIVAFIRLIVLYRAEAPNSFAAKSAHGAIFCNMAQGDDEVALLEDVAHQSAHVIFNAFSHDPMRLIAIDPETPMNRLSGEAADTRSINSALHALFTYTLIRRVLTSVLEAHVLPEPQEHEIMGRLGLILLKFADDLRLLDLPDALTIAGRRCYEAFGAEYQQFKLHYGARVAGFVYDNQPYNFDYSCFVERNGGPWPVAKGLGPVAKGLAS